MTGDWGDFSGIAGGASSGAGLSPTQNKSGGGTGLWESIKSNPDAYMRMVGNFITPFSPVVGGVLSAGAGVTELGMAGGRKQKVLEIAKRKSRGAPITSEEEVILKEGVRTPEKIAENTSTGVQAASQQIAANKREQRALGDAAMKMMQGAMTPPPVIYGRGTPLVQPTQRPAMTAGDIVKALLSRQRPA